MTWARRFLLRESLLEGLWLLPVLGAVLGAGLGIVVSLADEQIGDSSLWQYSPSTASTVLICDRRCDGRAHWLRGHRDRSRHADGDRDVLGPHHAPLVPRPPVEDDARGSRWHPHVLVLAAPADQGRLRTGPRRDAVRILRLPVPAGFHRLLRSMHPSAEAGGRRRRRCAYGSLHVRADRAPRRSDGHPVGVRGDAARSQPSSCGPAAAAQSRRSIPTVSSSGPARMAPSSCCRTR